MALTVCGCAPATVSTAPPAIASTSGAAEDWPSYGGDDAETHFSRLAQIDADNVGRLGLAWFIDLPTQINTHSAPVAVGGSIYFSTGLSHIHAVEAATGEALWDYDPGTPAAGRGTGALAWGVRGIAYSNGRIYTGTQDGRLIAIDAATGRPVWSVQTTKPGTGQHITGAPRVFDGKVVIGNGGADFSAVRGYVTPYDEATGERLWRFHTVPGNPADGFENDAMRMAAATWNGERWKQGGGGTAWNAITYDRELDRVYIGTGNGSPWNAELRSPGGGDNLFLCSIVALDARTGEYLWHYQLNPNETWDRNAAMDIELATLTIDGVRRRVLMQAPKNGFFYVIDRDTGELISAEPFAKQNWAERIDLETGRPVELPAARFPDGMAVVWPGGLGAHNWQAMAFSPMTGLVYIPTTEMPGVWDTAGIDEDTWEREPGLFSDTSFAPLKLDGPPPAGPVESMGHLQAWDPVRQRRVWTVDLGTPMNGGVLATAGNLVFQGNTRGRFAAYSADSGHVLWDFDTQTGIVAQPISYAVDGVQYVAVMVGVGGTPGLLGGLDGGPIWDYRAQKRRLLVFRLGGEAKLPHAATSGSARAGTAGGRSMEVAPELARAGEALYVGKCALCHGGGVAAGAAPDLRSSAARHDAAVFGRIVRNGILASRGMPSFDLTDHDLAALRHYLAQAAEQ